MNNWNTSNVVNMSSMFSNATTFNQPLNNWDTSQVTDMSSMFTRASAFNQNINNWDTSNVTHMISMFYGASAFNQPLNNWDISQVIYMSHMFYAATSFNQPLNNWDTSNVTHMISMFTRASAFNQNINNWDTSQVTYMSSMFTYATSFNQPLNNWDTSQVTNMSYMFSGATSFNQPLNNWDTSNVTKMSWMFSNATAFNQPLNNWDTSQVTDMSYIFQMASSFNQDLSAWDISKIVKSPSSYVYNDIGFSYSGLSFTNYDKILQAWSQQIVQPRVRLNAADVYYCSAQVARDKLTSSPNDWVIQDVGRSRAQACLDYLETLKPKAELSSQVPDPQLPFNIKELSPKDQETSISGQLIANKETKTYNLSLELKDGNTLIKTYNLNNFQVPANQNKEFYFTIPLSDLNLSVNNFTFQGPHILKVTDLTSNLTTTLNWNLTFSFPAYNILHQINGGNYIRVY